MGEPFPSHPEGLQNRQGLNQQASSAALPREHLGLRPQKSGLCAQNRALIQKAS